MAHIDYTAAGNILDSWVDYINLAKMEGTVTSINGDKFTGIVSINKSFDAETDSFWSVNFSTVPIYKLCVETSRGCTVNPKIREAPKHDTWREETTEELFLSYVRSIEFDEDKYALYSLIRDSL